MPISVSNYWQEPLSILQSDVAALSCSISERTDIMYDRFGELEDRITSLEVQLDKLREQLRPVLDEQIEKPKQKWLWEIFEPNDLNIDFPYNL